MKQYLPICLSLALVFTVSGCGLNEAGLGDSEKSSNTNLLFKNTDEVELTVSPGTDGTRPSFSWDADGTYYDYVVVSIFSAPFDMKSNAVVNPDDAVWTWNSEIGKGRPGDVLFSQGVDVTDGTPQAWSATGPAPLTIGATYYIALWGFDASFNLNTSSVVTEYTPEE